MILKEYVVYDDDLLTRALLNDPELVAAWPDTLPQMVQDMLQWAKGKTTQDTELLNEAKNVLKEVDELIQKYNLISDWISSTSGEQRQLHKVISDLTRIRYNLDTLIPLPDVSDGTARYIRELLDEDDRRA